MQLQSSGDTRVPFARTVRRVVFLVSSENFHHNVDATLATVRGAPGRVGVMTDSEGAGNIEAEDLEGDLSLDDEQADNVVGGLTPTQKAKKLAQEIDGVNVTKGMI